MLRFHDGPVNAVAFLKNGDAVTGGGDSRIAIWRAGQAKPLRTFEGHQGPIAAIAVSPDGETVASASWDRTIRLWALGTGTHRVLEGHTQAVNAVAFAQDGATLISAGYDATIRWWPLAGGQNAVLTVPSPLNAIALLPDREIVAGGASGKLFLVTAGGQLRETLDASPAPITALAVSPNGERIAAGGTRGAVIVVNRKAERIEQTLIGPGIPIWAVAFSPDGRVLMTGGADRAIRRWDAAKGDAIDPASAAADDTLAAYAGDHGADVFRACVACHTLGPDEGNKAGPSLAGLFGRRIATLPGYDFSPALKKLDIVWTPETVSKLFEVGPAEYTPGTKMPEQRITSAEDRQALVRFLEKATAAK